MYSIYLQEKRKEEASLRNSKELFQDSHEQRKKRKYNMI